MKNLITLLLALFVTNFGCANKSSDGGKEDSNSSLQQSEADGEKEARASLVDDIKKISARVQEAIRTSDFVTAKQGIRKGLALLGEDGKGLETRRAKLLLLFGIVEREEGREIDARRHFDDAMAIFHVHKDLAGKFETFLALGNLEARRGDYAASQRHYSAAEELMPKIEDRKLVGLYLEHTSRLASRQVDYKKARDGFSEAIKVFEEIQDKRQVAENLLLLAAEEDALQRSTPCLRSLNRAQSIFKDLEDFDGEARALHRMAAIAERGKKYRKARQLYQKVLDLYEKLDRTTAAAKLRQHLNALPEPE